MNAYLFSMSVFAWNATSLAHLPSTFLIPLIPAAASSIFSWNFSHTLTMRIKHKTNHRQCILFDLTQPTLVLQGIWLGSLHSESLQWSLWERQAGQSGQWLLHRWVCRCLQLVLWHDPVEDSWLSAHHLPLWRYSIYWETHRMPLHSMWSIYYKLVITSLGVIQLTLSWLIITPLGFPVVPDCT